MLSGEKTKGWGTRMTVTLNDGRKLEGARDTFLGCPETPMSAEQLRTKFAALTQDSSQALQRTLFDDLMRLQDFPSLDALVLA
jgi:2-methylcitrate dehydratase PrpD